MTETIIVSAQARQEQKEKLNRLREDTGMSIKHLSVEAWDLLLNKYGVK